jgi:hypothetical protein
VFENVEARLDRGNAVQDGHDLALTWLCVGVESDPPELGEDDGARGSSQARDVSGTTSNGHNNGIVDPRGVNAVLGGIGNQSGEKRVGRDLKGRGETCGNKLGLHGGDVQSKDEAEGEVGDTCTRTESFLRFGNPRAPTHLPPRVAEQVADDSFEVGRGAHLSHDRGLAHNFKERIDEVKVDADGSNELGNVFFGPARGEKQNPHGRVESALDIDEGERAGQSTVEEQINKRLDDMR